MWYGGRCKCCGELNEPYMIHNELWKAVDGGKGLICLLCVEDRLGRPLTLNDFTQAPINYGAFLFHAEDWVHYKDLIFEVKTLIHLDWVLTRSNRI